MFWISLILVSLFFVFYWLWPKNELGNTEKYSNEFNPYETQTIRKKNVTVEKVVYFEAGMSKLVDNEILNLKRWFTPDSLQSLDSVLLIGSADSSGNLAANRKLVKERIQAIRKILVSFGITPEKISTLPLEPVHGRSAKEREKFRSVQIKMNFLG
ncbi:OmpA family protein [Leptospira bouyouniensis]|uniref:Cell envelope biogenesis protein OmpA n=1 Tax=Leptospira bouyouniensis TaxID=2484911 RepID=A0ABY2L7R4_9LEPT|nr:OmpA family protein [Leptospira bouyouniensis]TGK52690.1 hypothetical protein EHQ10_02760 [Leptospira bouyouniensis]